MYSWRCLVLLSTVLLTAVQTPARRQVALIVTHGIVVTVDGNRRVIENGAVAIDGRDIVAVDMRLPDRLVVQLSEDAAKAREELFKDKKKKKAGDAA